MLDKYPYANIHELNLDWIIAKLKELEVSVEEVLELSKNWDSTVQELENRMLAIENESARLSSIYDSFVEEVNQKFDELTLEQVAQFETLTESINNRFATLESNIETTLSNFNSRLNYLDRKLDETLNNLPNLIYMISPFSGQLDNITNIINELAGGQRVNALTALEYDNLELTASAYDNYELTAYEFDWNGKQLLI